MSNNEYPQTAAEAVDYLFADSTPLSYDSLLVPNTANGDFLSAIESAFADSVHDPPSVTLLAPDSDVQELAEESTLDVTIQHEQFLGDPVSLQTEFEYVLAEIPSVSWQTLSSERRRAIAANSGSVTTVDAELDQTETTYLFVEQALRHLSHDGRAVLLSPPVFVDTETESDLRQRLYRHVELIEEFSPEEHEGLSEPLALTVLAGDDDRSSAPLVQYEAREYESMLNGRVDTEHRFTAKAVMTPDPRTYDATRSAASVYTDLIAEDYEAAPVCEDGGLIGFVSREILRANEHATVGRWAEPVQQPYVLDEGEPIAEVIERLRQHRFQFVLADGDLQGVITRFDLNQLPVYLHLFDCFSEFEIGLRNLIRRGLPDWDTKTDVYVPKRHDESLYADRLASTDLGRLIGIVEEGGLKRRIQRDIDGYEADLDQLRQLRNSVAHYNPIIHTMSDTDTMDEQRRSALQLAAEYDLLQGCIEGLS